MQYINSDTLEYPISEWDIRQANKHISFPIPFSPPDGFLPVNEVEIPAFDKYTQKAVEGAPALEEDTWYQTWQIVSLSPEEAKAMVPSKVTMRQARLALLSAGLLASIDQAIEGLPSPQKEAAQIEWEYGQEVDRYNGFVSVLVPLLGLTDAQVDQLFISAASF